MGTDDRVAYHLLRRRFFPASLGGLSLGLVEYAGRQMVGSDVDAWTSQGADRLVFTAPGATERPAYVSNAGDGAPALDFDGTNYLIHDAGGPDPDADFSLVVLCQNDVDTVVFSQSRPAENSNGSSFMRVATFIDHVLINDAGASIGEAALAFSAGWHVLTTRRSGSTLKVRVDGSADTTAAISAGTITPLALTVGGWRVNGGATSLYDGKLRAILLYGRHISDLEVNTLRAWMASVWPSVP